MQLTSQFLSKSRVRFNSQMYKGLYLFKKSFGICVCVITSATTGGATPKMLHKKASSCTQQSVTSDIKRLSIKILKLITRKAKNSSLSCALSGFLSAALCIASESGHHSINLFLALGYQDPELQSQQGIIFTSSVQGSPQRRDSLLLSALCHS